MIDYALEGPKWGTPNLGTAGGSITWAVDGNVSAVLLNDITSAFTAWSTYANIQFQQVSSTAASAIDLSFGYIDGPNNILGMASYSFSGTSFRSAGVEFDAGEGWHAVNAHGVSNSGVSFYIVALHEIGHAIGMDHYNTTTAVMNAYINPNITGLLTSDIHGIQALYGAALSPHSTLADSLVNQQFYFASYADVAQSGMTASSHYDNFGWNEGRSPNAYFSTLGYLAANQDVSLANVNPLDHYDSIGWREGRDPSANFDTQLYLERNPDVRAAGIDPLAHYLSSGQAEGRQTYAAVGDATSFTHGSFDAGFYLLNNPDVARAAITSGANSFEFAYSHYEQFGWHEGRNPNSVFDVNGYLRTFADVRAAGIDPLAHYDTSGWKEGRDPSASFDTRQYLSHYNDVASLQLDPLQHFLQYGIHEGRSTFSDGILG